MRSPLPALLPLLVAVALATPALAQRTWQVPLDAPTIQAGLDSAASGDVVAVAAGTYQEHDLAVPSGVTLRGEGGEVVIDAQELGRVLTCTDANEYTRIEDLILTGGLAAGTFPDDLGGGLLCSNASPWISRCTFLANAGNYGGAVHCRDDSRPQFSSCLFLENHSASLGGAAFCATGASVTFENTTFSGNVADEGGGVLHCAAGQASFYYCTFSGNSAPSGSALSLWDGSLVTHIASLIAFNGPGAASVHDTGSTPQFLCSDLYGNAGGDWSGNLTGQLGTGGNIAADPQFCSSQPHEHRNWSLQSDSPCSPAISPCNQIGAWGVGCGAVGTRRTSWGDLKTRYR